MGRVVFRLIRTFLWDDKNLCDHNKRGWGFWGDSVLMDALSNCNMKFKIIMYDLFWCFIICWDNFGHGEGFLAMNDGVFSYLYHSCKWTIWYWWSFYYFGNGCGCWTDLTRDSLVIDPRINEPPFGGSFLTLNLVGCRETWKW